MSRGDDGRQQHLTTWFTHTQPSCHQRWQTDSNHQVPCHQCLLQQGHRKVSSNISQEQPHMRLAAKSHGRKPTLGPAPAKDSEQNLEEDKNRPKTSSRRGTNPPTPPAEQVQHHPRVPAHGGAGSDGPQRVLHQGSPS